MPLSTTVLSPSLDVKATASSADQAILEASRSRIV